ncbi:hypothetical protein M514_14905 [Trichuris suis]|uniref:Uncharacterized protein n=1 Tax=Trichuris suis TaxID=68888 RepID=A0A085NU55_9BILA|nr:hypothetical protein M514_14905 [Trichuris suis]
MTMHKRSGKLNGRESGTNSVEEPCLKLFLPLYPGAERQSAELRETAVLSRGRDDDGINDRETCGELFLPDESLDFKSLCKEPNFSLRKIKKASYIRHSGSTNRDEGEVSEIWSAVETVKIPEVERAKEQNREGRNPER